MAKEMELIDAVRLSEILQAFVLFVNGKPATQAEYREAVLKIISEQPQIRVKIADAMEGERQKYEKRNALD